MKLLLFFVLSAFVSAQCPPNAQYFPHFNKCYLFVTNRATFSVAESYCLDQGGHLLSIENNPENLIVAEMAANVPDSLFMNFYIGANALETAPNYVWTDGSPMNYTRWMPVSQPDIAAYPSHQCVYFTPGDGMWVATECSQKHQFICGITGTLSTINP